MVNGIEWNDKWPIGSKKPTMIKRVPNEERVKYDILSITDKNNLNIQSLMFKSDCNVIGRVFLESIFQLSVI
jgi:hypothetical protein